MKFEGKRVLVTGSTGGLGLSYAKAFAEAGADVVLNGRNPEKIDKVETEFRKSGYKVNSVCFDVKDQKKVKESIDGIESNIGPIDVLVNNAGIQIRAHFLKVDFDDLDTVIKTNLYGPFYVGQAVAHHMAKRKKGKIINICSLQSELARYGIPAYAVSKGGIRMLTKAMAIDLAEYNIQVNGVGPGYIATEMNMPLKENKEFDSWITKRTPMGRWAEESELNGAVLFLASEEANFITGQILFVDGGIIASI